MDILHHGPGVIIADVIMAEVPKSPYPHLEEAFHQLGGRLLRDAEDGHLGFFIRQTLSKFLMGWTSIPRTVFPISSGESSKIPTSRMPRFSKSMWLAMARPMLPAPSRTVSESRSIPRIWPISV